MDTAVKSSPLVALPDALLTQTEIAPLLPPVRATAMLTVRAGACRSGAVDR
jgi:hypothetical protein